jgi:hypothetical protein
MVFARFTGEPAAASVLVKGVCGAAVPKHVTAIGRDGRGSGAWRLERRQAGEEAGASKMFGNECAAARP